MSVKWALNNQFAQLITKHIFVSAGKPRAFGTTDTGNQHKHISIGLPLCCNRLLWIFFIASQKQTYERFINNCRSRNMSVQQNNNSSDEWILQTLSIECIGQYAYVCMISNVGAIYYTYMSPPHTSYMSLAGVTYMIPEWHISRLCHSSRGLMGKLWKRFEMARNKKKCNKKCLWGDIYCISWVTYIAYYHSCEFV